MYLFMIYFVIVYVQGPVHSRYDPDQVEDEEEDDMFGTTDFRVTQMISPGQRSSDQEDICLSPNDSGRNESPFSPSSASFHEATLWVKK